MKTLTTITLMFFLVGVTFSQKVLERTLNDVTIKPLGGIVLDSVIYDKGLRTQRSKSFNKEGKLLIEKRRGGDLSSGYKTEIRTRYTYTNQSSYIQMVDSVAGGLHGISKRTFNATNSNLNEWRIEYFNIRTSLNSLSQRYDSCDMKGNVLKSRLDSIAKDGTHLRWIYEYTYGEQGTVQETRFEAIFPSSGKYVHTKDTMQVKAYARTYYNTYKEVDYFITKTDTIVGYPFIFALQPQPVPFISSEQVVVTKDQYGNILTASYNGHTATFYYSKVATSLFENKADNGLKVYPTIITSTLNITDYNSLKIVSVFNLSGSLVHKEEVENNSIDLYFLSKGMYIISIETEAGISNHKIIKQ